MKKTRKIVLIGAGSAVFTHGLVADLIVSTDLGDWELGLVDIDPSALETAEGISRKMIAARQANITVQASTDRRDVLPGADLVVLTVGVESRAGWEKDAYLPRKFGVFQPVGDSVLPGGISKAMRQVPALVAIAEDVKKLCPEAMLVNYANPMTVNCWAIRQATGIPVVGLCHGVFHVTRELAGLAGAPLDEVTALFAGLNHLTFIYDFRWNGESLWPILEKRWQAEKDLPPDPMSLGKTFPAGLKTSTNPFSWSLYEAYGAYPAVNDRHACEFFPERFPNGDYYGMKLGVDAFSVEEIIAWGEARYQNMRSQALGQKPLDTDIFNRTAGEHEQLIAILRSITFDQRKIFSVNMPNQGAVPNLPDDAILEMPAVATATGLRPIQLPDFPSTLAAIINRKLASARLTMEAALRGDRRLFVEAILADGAVHDRQTASRLADTLLEAHREWLPNFY
jgi:alpha-galactosidase